MDETEITLNEKKLIAYYEYDCGEPRTHDHPGANPSVRLFRVTDSDDNDLSSNLTSAQWEDASQQCFENSND